MTTLSKFSLTARGILTGMHILRQSNYKEKFEHLSLVHKNYICEMQGQLADYALIARTKHEALREAVQVYDSRNGQNPKRRPSLKGVRRCLSQLTQFLEHGHAKACKATFDALKEHFSLGRKSNLHEPRFCIKLVRKGHVFTFLRDRGQSGGLQPITDAIQENTGFHSVGESGNFFFCNDIPTETKGGRYVNPRLRRECASDYSSSWRWSLKRACSRNQPAPDNNWINCWNGGADGSNAAAEQCYKSTLIVPMTLRYSQVSHDFWTVFEQHVDAEHPFEKGSFGFLCMDCHEEDFFDMEIDSHFGYVCADILSLFSVATYLYTSLSPPYRKATTIMNRT
ncbi:MAG: hypothetical protein HY847_15210 [Betaproteobacteria bacterium]|nr:hypothetical protein [Betaproteobacteria bacterium]